MSYVMQSIMLSLSVIMTVLAATRLQAQQHIWHQTAGPYGGRINALLVTQEGIVLAGTSVGAFRSTDNGTTWSRSGPSPLTAQVRSFAVDSSRNIMATTSDGLFRSTDRGTTWNRYGPSFPDLISIAFDPKGRMYVGGTGRMYELADTGREYWRESSYLPVLTVRSLCVTPTGKLVAGTTDVIYVSTDEGATWSSSDSGIENGMYCGSIRALAVDTRSHLYAATSCGLFHSTDDGVTWNAVRGPLEGRDVSTINAHGDHLWAGTRQFGIFHSTDNGVSWQEMYVGLESAGISAFAAAPNGNVYCGTTHGIQRSTNQGRLWEVTDQGVIATTIRCMASDSKGWIFAGTETGMWRTTDQGVTWNGINYLLTNRDVHCITIDSADNIWIGTKHGDLFRSSDRGNSWLDLKFPDDHSIEAILIERDGSVLIGSSSFVARIWRTSDLGGQWSPASHTGMYVMDMARGRGRITHAITWDNGVWNIAADGSGWHFEFGASHCLNMVSDAKGCVYIGGTSGFEIHVTENDGFSWTTYSHYPEVCPGIGAVALDSMGTLYAGTSCGVFQSWDAAKSWRPDTAGMGTREISAITVAPDGSLYAGTIGSGIYRRSVGSASIPAHTTGVDHVQIAPNPVSTTSSISFTLQRRESLVLTLVDRAGRHCVTLAERSFGAGNHTVVFDAEYLPSGIYLLKIAGTDRIITSPLSVVH